MVISGSQLHPCQAPYVTLLTRLWYDQFDDLNRVSNDALYVIGTSDHLLSNANFYYQDLRKNQLTVDEGYIARILLQPLSPPVRQELFLLYNADRNCPFLWKLQLSLVISIVLTLADVPDSESRVSQRLLTQIAQQLLLLTPPTLPWHFFTADADKMPVTLQDDLESICGMVRGHNLPASPWLRDLLLQSSSVVRTFTLFNEEPFALRTIPALENGVDIEFKCYAHDDPASTVHWLESIEATNPPDHTVSDDDEEL